MTTQLKWKLVAGGAAVVAAVAAGAAIASTHDDRGGTIAVAPAPFGPGDRPGRGGDPLAAASAYLGISTSDLATQLRSGKTLAAIADATSGKSAAGLVDALVAGQKQQLEQAVTDGRLTRDQADRIESDLKQRVTDQVNGSFGLPRRPFGPGGPTRRGTV